MAPASLAGRCMAVLSKVSMLGNGLRQATSERLVEQGSNIRVRCCKPACSGLQRPGNHLGLCHHVDEAGHVCRSPALPSRSSREPRQS